MDRIGNLSYSLMSKKSHAGPGIHLWYKCFCNLKLFQALQFTSQEILPPGHAFSGWSFLRNMALSTHGKNYRFSGNFL